MDDTDLLLKTIRNTPQNAEAQRATQMEVDRANAWLLSEKLERLSTAVNDLANRAVTVMNNSIEQSKQSAEESGKAALQSAKVAAESAALSRQLNSLTKWIMAATFAASLAAIVQAGVAIYQIVEK